MRRIPLPSLVGEIRAEFADCPLMPCDVPKELREEDQAEEVLAASSAFSFGAGT
jgi:hypothetical protein